MVISHVFYLILFFFIIMCHLLVVLNLLSVFLSLFLVVLHLVLVVLSLCLVVYHFLSNSNSLIDLHSTLSNMGDYPGSQTNKGLKNPKFTLCYLEKLPH